MLLKQKKRFNALPFATFAIALFAVTAAANAPAYAQKSVEEFYKGKTIDFYIGFSVGGGYDLYARTVGRFLGNHIPGKPRVIAKNMTGAGSRVAGNYIYNIAPKDGTVLGSIDQSIPLEQAIGDTGVKFDTRNFNWIGSPVVDSNLLVTWHTSHVKTVEDAREREVPIGAAGSTSSQYPQVMNSLVGTKFKIIQGYPGANELDLAMENGEVAGRGSSSWASWKANKPHWVSEKKLNFIVQIGLKKAADLPDVPLLIDLAKNDDDRRALMLVSAPPSMGRPIFTSPGVPAERVKALRDAFDATMKDPEFIAEMQKLKLDLSPISGVEIQKIVSDIIDTPKPIKDRLASILALIETGKR